MTMRTIVLACAGTDGAILAHVLRAAMGPHVRTVVIVTPIGTSTLRLIDSVGAHLRTIVVRCASGSSVAIPFMDDLVRIVARHSVTTLGALLDCNQSHDTIAMLVSAAPSVSHVIVWTPFVPPSRAGDPPGPTLDACFRRAAARSGPTRRLTMVDRKQRSVASNANAACVAVLQRPSLLAGRVALESDVHALAIAIARTEEYGRRPAIALPWAAADLALGDGGGHGEA